MFPVVRQHRETSLQVCLDSGSSRASRKRLVNKQVLQLSVASLQLRFCLCWRLACPRSTGTVNFGGSFLRSTGTANCSWAKKERRGLETGDDAHRMRQIDRSKNTAKNIGPLGQLLVRLFRVLFHKKTERLIHKQDIFSQCFQGRHVRDSVCVADGRSSRCFVDE